MDVDLRLADLDGEGIGVALAPGLHTVGLKPQAFVEGREPLGVGRGDRNVVYSDNRHGRA